MPVWLFAAVPAALFGHLLAYLAQGRSMADSSHRYFSGAIELAAAVVLLAAAAAAVDAILQATRDLRVPSLAPLWLTLAVCQILIFGVLERMESNTPTLVGCLVQVIVALMAATLVRWLFHLAKTLARIVVQSRYRVRPPSGWFSEPVSAFNRSAALRVCLGESRFQRPPPVFA